MVATIKFSQFAAASLTNTTNKLVGVSALSSGNNFYTDFPLIWITANRPVMPPAGTQGYNSTLGQIEYWNGAAWVQLAAGGSGSVNVGSANELAFYSSTGSAVSGFMNSPSRVLITTSGSVPQWANTLPSALTLPQPVIQGVTNALGAASGQVGEVISSNVVFGASIVLSNGVPANVTSINLTAGNWIINGSFSIFSSSQRIQQALGWTSQSSATLPDSSLYNGLNSTNSQTVSYGSNTPQRIINTTVPVTVYLSVQAFDVMNTIVACGGISAVRYM